MNNPIKKPSDNPVTCYGSVWTEETESHENQVNAILASNEAYAKINDIAIGILRNARLVTVEHLDIILNGKSDCHISISEGICNLYYAGILQQYRDVLLISGGHYADQASSIITDLHILEIATPENLKAVLGSNCFNIYRAIWILRNAQIWNKDNVNAILAAHGNYAEVISTILSHLNASGILTAKNRNAVLAGLAVGRVSRIRQKLHSILQARYMTHPGMFQWEQAVNQERFDRIIREIEELEWENVAKNLGWLNSQIPDSMIDLRIPSETIGDIATLGLAQEEDLAKKRYDEAVKIAERVERAFL